MKTLKSYLKRLVAIGLAALVVAVPITASAQGFSGVGVQVQPFYTQYVGTSISAVSTDVAIIVKYTGSSNVAADINVAAADSDVTLRVSAANDATVNIQAGGLGPCGAAVGTLDTADTDCDTLGELVDHINASANWSAAIVTGLRSDATANTLLTVGTTDAKIPTGVKVFWETPQALAVNVALVPLADGVDVGIQNWLGRDNTGRVSGRLARRPFIDRDTTMLYYSEKVTSTGAVGNIIVYCSYDNYVEDQQAASTQTDVTLYFEAGAATTVTGKIDEFVNAGGLTCVGGRLWARISATTDLTAPSVVISGYQKQRRLQ